MPVRHLSGCCRRAAAPVTTATAAAATAECADASRFGEYLRADPTRGALCVGI